MSVPSIAFYPPLAPSAHLRRARAALPFPFGDPGCTLHARGRVALFRAAGALGLGAGDEVLVPAWHHGAEIEALHRAGLVPVFYEARDDLAPDADELERVTGPRTRALVVTHFLGFPQDAARWRAWCDERGLLLVEDAAHALYARAGARPAGGWGDAAIWCLFKSLPVPDGAALRLRHPAPGPDPQPAPGGAAAVRRHAAWVAQRAPALARAADRRRSGRPYDPAGEIALGDPGLGPAAVTARLLPRVAGAWVGTRRRAHYAALLDVLEDRVPEPFSRLPDGAVPLGLPVTTPDKARVLELLGARGIDAVDLWADPHPLAAGGFPGARARRLTTVVLPVHQGLGPRDLERVADAATAATRPRRAVPAVRVERAGAIDELRDDWDQLALRAGSVFATPDWTETWARHFLRGRALQLVAFRDGAGRLVGVLAAHAAAGRRAGVLRVAGHGPGDELGVACDPRDRLRVARALPSALELLGARALLAEQVPRGAGWSTVPGARVLRSEGSPVIRLDPPDWDGWIARHSRNLRKEIRRNDRRLRTEHDVRYRLVAGPRDDVTGDFDRLLELHRARFPGDSSSFGRDAAFHRDFAAVAAARGRLRLWFAEAGGRAVAASYGFRLGDVESDYQGGRDPAWDGPSLGFGLQLRAIRAALDDGVREYRLLRGGEAYKYRLADDDPGLETLLVARGPVMAAAGTAGAALPKPLRRRLARA